MTSDDLLILPLASASCCGPDDACAPEPASDAASAFDASPDAVRAAVRATYAAAATATPAPVDGCGPACGCTPGAALGVDFIGDAYADLAGYVPDADLRLGCGIPTEHAALAEGETVLDLGSGAGIDAFVARRAVGESGRVIGVDMTPEMIARARANVAALGYTNVAFRLGEIEALPVDAETVDVVVSNCVLNLVPDKDAAFAEMHRVLRPGGRFCVSDVVLRGALPEAVRASAEMWGACVSGALREDAYLDGLRRAGFADARVVEAKPLPVPAEYGVAPGIVVSVTVVGTKAS